MSEAYKIQTNDTLTQNTTEYTMIELRTLSCSEIARLSIRGIHKQICTSLYPSASLV
jgi:hypothetical protein